jgi:Ca2+-binding EF-hand superfamily protein
MVRPILALVAATAVLASSLAAADLEPKDQNAARFTKATITKVDARKGEITVRCTDAQGKTQEKIFHLADEVRLLDETGRVVNIDVLESGNEALIVESAGKLKEIRRAPSRGRLLTPVDTVRSLIEMSERDPACTAELQKIYDALRKLDTNHNGQVDPQALKAEADTIVRERVQDIFNRLDANKDGKISRDEARGLIKKDFDQIDTNKDGFIEFDELLKAAKQPRQIPSAENKANAPKLEQEERK